MTGMTYPQTAIPGQNGAYTELPRRTLIYTMRRAG
jgi:hypothetical protein